MSQEGPTPQVLELLEMVRTAVQANRLSEAEAIMLKVRELIASDNPNPLKPRRKPGWG
ncbi:MAG TPA: hypothetical protein VJB95_02040 [Candidatus Paceibacterota bacterium]